MEKGFFNIKLTAKEDSVLAETQIDNFNMLIAAIELGRILNNSFEDYPIARALLLKELCD